tara:strand:+ start:2707 stop:4005 length:1299 start_codon:yes stop_codon:yes gene_type:complete
MSDNGIVISVMSHKRPEVLNNNTMKYLICNVSTSYPIFVFVSGISDYKKYTEYFANFSHPITIIKAPNDYLKKCNYITRYFPVDQKVFWMEDDIEELQILKDNKLVKLKKFDFFVKNGFEKCIENNTKIFGIYPVVNSYFMREYHTTDFRFLIANAFGFISEHYNNKHLCCHSDAKTDYERSVLYYENFGKVIRFNNVCAITNNYTNKGGLNDGDRKDREADAVFYLTTYYPQYFDIKKKRKYSKSKFLELRCKKIKEGDIYNQLYNQIKSFSIPLNVRRHNVSGIKKIYEYINDWKFGLGKANRKEGNPCKSITFGISKGIYQTDIVQKKNNRTYKKYYNLLKNYVQKLYPHFKYTNITLNNNLQCLPHKDALNVGDSLIFGFGDYTGGALNVEGTSHDIYKKPFIFDGYKEKHWVEKFAGDRWTCVLYNY